MPTPDSHEITRLLLAWGDGDREALERLMPLVYDELRRLAQGYMRREHTGHTLQTTALIHEAYLRLIDANQVRLENRTHFFAVAARLMRQILVDHARTKRRDKRGGTDAVKVELDEALQVGSEAQNVDLLALDDALNRLAKKDPDQARLVELCYFSGLSLEETAEAMKISRATAARDWNVAKAWLKRELTR